MIFPEKFLTVAMGIWLILHQPWRNYSLYKTEALVTILKRLMGQKKAIRIVSQLRRKKDALLRTTQYPQLANSRNVQMHYLLKERKLDGFHKAIKINLISIAKSLLNNSCVQN